MSSRRERFVDTSPSSMIVVDLNQMRKDIQDVFRVSTGIFSSDHGAVLRRERAADPEYDRAWKIAEKMYEKKKPTLKSVSTLGSAYHMAIMVYTLEDPDIYTTFNRLSRGLNTSNWEQFPYKSLWYMLGVALPSLVSDPPLGNTLYRGVSYYLSGADRLEPGNLVMFKSFASTSTNIEVAQGFLRGTGTLIEFRHRPMAGKGIRPHSRFPDEDEVLLCPWTSYSVKSHDRSGPIHRLVLQTAGPLSGELPYNSRE